MRENTGERGDRVWERGERETKYRDRERENTGERGDGGRERRERETSRVSPFRLKICFAYKRNKANLDPFHLCFTISL